MPQADASSFTRVVVVAPRSRVDVALPSDVPVVDLLPGLLDMVGERSADGGGAHDGWRLSTVDGDQLDPSRTLRSLDVLDGATLRMAPTRAPLAPPVHDDVVEAIAEAVRARTDARSIRDSARAFCVAVLLVTCALALLLGATGLVGAAVAAGVTAVALVVGRALAVGRSWRIGHTLAVASAAPAAAAGSLALPGGELLPHLLLPCAAALAVVVVCRLLLPGAGSVLAGLATTLGMLVVGTLVGLLLRAPITSVLVALSAVSIAAMSFLPWFAVRMARLPMPRIPTSGADLAPAATLPQDELSRRARAGAELADGALVACAVVAAAGALAAASTGRPLGIAYCVVVLVILLLRSRSVDGRAPRWALVGLAVVTAALALLLGATRVEAFSALGLAVACALATIGVAVAALLPERDAPVAGRWLELLEVFLLVALLPLALGAVDLYSYVRHL